MTEVAEKCFTLFIGAETGAVEAAALAITAVFASYWALASTLAFSACMREPQSVNRSLQTTMLQVSSSRDLQ